MMNVANGAAMMSMHKWKAGAVPKPRHWATRSWAQRKRWYLSWKVIEETSGHQRQNWKPYVNMVSIKMQTQISHCLWENTELTSKPVSAEAGQTMADTQRNFGGAEHCEPQVQEATTTTVVLTEWQNYWWNKNIYDSWAVVVYLGGKGSQISVSFKVSLV